MHRNSAFLLALTAGLVASWLPACSSSDTPTDENSGENNNGSGAGGKLAGGGGNGGVKTSSQNGGGAKAGNGGASGQKAAGDSGSENNGGAENGGGNQGGGGVKAGSAGGAGAAKGGSGGGAGNKAGAAGKSGGGTAGGVIVGPSDGGTAGKAATDGGTASPTDGGSTGNAGAGGCAKGPGVISNFEEGDSVDPPVVIDQDGRKGAWERFYGTDSTNFKMKVEASGSGEECSKWALHATGASAGGWGDWAGIGLNLTGTIENPNIYDASKYTGIRFRAKKGTGHDAKSAVRFNVPIPETEGTGSPGDNDKCEAVSESTEKAARDCYQHMGRFLHVVSGYDPDNELTSSWKTFTYCFDSDLYPLSLPGNLSNNERKALSSKILKIQFQFNKGKDWYVSQYPNEGQYEELESNLPFDFWLDDIEFFGGDCPKNDFKSASGTAKPFPQNKAISDSCGAATDADKLSTAISQAYARWTKNFVRTDGSNAKVIAPEQENGVTTSEAMGYGMLIAAAMGDKTAFDKFWGYVKGQGGGSGLMTWKTGGSGSATDGDVDIAYALLMATAQWGDSYKSAADGMVSAFKSGDVDGAKLKPGNTWSDAFNPSYFAPSYLGKFGGMTDVISNSYKLIQADVTAATAGFPTDWTDWSGAPRDPAGQVTAKFTSAAYGYDAARVPWRIGLDGCTNESGSGATGKSIATTIVNFFANIYDKGATIDLMKAGWIKKTGKPAGSGDGAVAADMQGSFIGPIGVGAMASGDTVTRDRAFRTVLDILENGDFNHTYFPSTVGMITLLIMSGNFPLP